MESSVINWMKKHRELQDSHLELLREYQQLKARCEKMEVALNAITGKTMPVPNKADMIEIAAQALNEEESNTPAPVEGKEPWIPMAEKLPELTEPLTWWDDETNTRELIIANHHAIVLAYNTELGVYKAKFECNKWSEISSRSNITTKETIPTHWMPMPSAPDESSEKEVNHG